MGERFPLALEVWPTAGDRRVWGVFLGVLAFSGDI